MKVEKLLTIRIIHGVRYAADIPKMIVATNIGFNLIDINTTKMVEKRP